MNEARAPDCAAAIVAAFARYNTAYRAITRRAPERFANRDWGGSQSDVVERLDLYASSVHEAVAGLRELLGERAHDVDRGIAIKAAYSERIATLADPDGARRAAGIASLRNLTERHIAAE